MMMRVRSSRSSKRNEGFRDIQFWFEEGLPNRLSEENVKAGSDSHSLRYIVTCHDSESFILKDMAH